MDDKHGQNSPDSSMINNKDQNRRQAPSAGGLFEIRVKGHLNSKWSDWLDGLDIELLNNGEMILSGLILDQSALMGILDKLNRLNLTLLSVSEVSKNE